MRATLSILGLTSYRDDLWDNLVIPSGLRKEDLIDEICFDYADLELVYPDADIMKSMIGIWSRRNLPIWQKLYDTTLLEYNPIWNVDAHIVENRTTSSDGTTYGDQSVAVNRTDQTEHIAETDTTNSKNGELNGSKNGETLSVDKGETTTKGSLNESTTNKEVVDTDTTDKMTGTVDTDTSETNNSTTNTNGTTNTTKNSTNNTSETNNATVTNSSNSFNAATLLTNNQSVTNETNSSNSSGSETGKEENEVSTTVKDTKTGTVDTTTSENKTGTVDTTTEQNGERTEATSGSEEHSNNVNSTMSETNKETTEESEVGKSKLEETSSSNENESQNTIQNGTSQSTVLDSFESYRNGNIGVTATQDLIEKERAVVLFDIYQTIKDSFAKRFCILVY